MLLMCLWVVVYSFFTSISFNREVEVLFSTVGFWTTVVFAIILALGKDCLSRRPSKVTNDLLGPRFITKYVNEAYFPSDRDIIREAWVVGDLKSRLGIKRRRTKPEDASLYRPHVRDTSDHSSDQEAGEYRPVTSPIADDYELVPGTAYDYPHRNHSPRREPTAMSYYSASEIPYDPTPTSPNERRRSAGMPPASPNTLHPASALQRRPSKSPPSSPYKATPPSPLAPSQQTSAPTHLTAQPRSTPDEYEMTARAPPLSPQPSSYSRTTHSRASYVTASDGWGSDHDDNATVRQHGPRESYYPNDQH